MSTTNAYSPIQVAFLKLIVGQIESGNIICIVPFIVTPCVFQKLRNDNFDHNGQDVVDSGYVEEAKHERIWGDGSIDAQKDMLKHRSNLLPLMHIISS